MSGAEKQEWIKKSRMKFLLRLMLKVAAWFVGLSLFLVLLFKWIPVPVTNLMLIRTVQQITSGQKIILKPFLVPKKKIFPPNQLSSVCHRK